MAEQEVIKHTKKVFGILREKEHSIWQKVQDLFIEIFIIVFAISLSIWFHNWSEHRSEQKQVRTFLFGLKHDIGEDIAQTRGIIEQYKQYDTLYTYMARFSRDWKPSKDSLDLCVGMLNSNIFLRPNKSRFNGFLSAGKIEHIENDSLVSTLLYYYQEVLPAVQSSEGGWGKNQVLLNDFLMENTKNPEDNWSYWEALATPRGRYFSRQLIPWGQIYERYNVLIAKGETIMALIDKEYPNL